MREITSNSEEETVELAREFAGRLASGDVVALYGNLGAGKTVFTQGVCIGLGITDDVVSPTFTLINEYRHASKELAVYHIDCYRINSREEVDQLGLEEYLYGNGICLIEWAERASHILNAPHWRVHLQSDRLANIRKILIEKTG